VHIHHQHQSHHIHHHAMAVLCRRYFICDKKLLNLGWKEATTWEEGLGRTIEWYKKMGSRPEYWENGDMEAALVPHPTLQQGLRPNLSVKNLSLSRNNSQTGGF
jgi:hypothetical protein